MLYPPIKPAVRESAPVQSAGEQRGHEQGRQEEDAAPEAEPALPDEDAALRLIGARGAHRPVTPLKGGLLAAMLAHTR